MTKQEMKKLINEQFGFSVNKIVLLESYGDGTYIMFAVCNVQYQMNYSNVRQCYILSVYDSNETVLNVLGA